MTDLSGHTIGQYEIIEEIGRGGMAVVYRARQLNLNREVAIKVLPSTMTHDPTFLERFNREVRLMARMQHARILPVYDFGEDQGRPYIVMAYMAGGTLADRLKDGYLDTPLVVHYLKQIAEGLDSLHQRGVIHRDFKPNNVLLDAKQHNVFLADFGIARLSEASITTLTGDSIIGTPAYMAPEMYEKSQLTTAVDIYALGITLFEMLTLRKPYQATSPVKYMYAHLYDEIPDVREDRPDLPESVQRVIQTALVKDPAYRYPTASDLAAAFAHAVNKPLAEPYHLDLTHPPESPAPRMAPTNHEASTMDVDRAALPTVSAPQSSRRRSVSRVVMGIGGALAVGTVLFIGVLLSSTPRGSETPEAETTSEEEQSSFTVSPSSEPPTPTATLANAPNELAGEDEGTLALSAVGGGTGLLGFSAAGQRYTVDVDCIITGQTECNTNPLVLNLPSGINQAQFGKWSPDGQLIAFTGLQGSTSYLFLTSLGNPESVQLTEGPATDPAWSPDGSRLAFASGDSTGFDIWTANLECFQAEGEDCFTQITSDSALETSPGWTPDGERITYLQQQTSTLYAAFVTTPGQGTVQAITPAGHDSSNIQWLPDGSRWLFVDRFRTSGTLVGTLFYDIGLQVASSDDPEPGRVITLSRGDFGTECSVGLCPGGGEFSISPDGRLAAITYAADAREDLELYLLDLACLAVDPSACADDLVQVTDNNFDDRLPVWSPDGGLIAFVRARSTSLQAGLEEASRNAGADVFVLDVNQWLTTSQDDAIWQITSLGFVDFVALSWQPLP